MIIQSSREGSSGNYKNIIRELRSDRVRPYSFYGIDLIDPSEQIVPLPHDFYAL